MKKMPLILLALLIGLFSFAQTSYIPPNGLVPDEETAKKIAEAIWSPIYGKEQIASEKPYIARLIGDSVWLVKGSLPKGYDLGGVAYIEIRKKDCTILNLYHDK